MTGTCHATALIVGTAGILIRGPSGSGKSLLARDLLVHARTTARFAALVGDDRIRLQPLHGRLIAHGLPQTAGAIEMRGRGVETLQYRNAAVIRLVIDFVPLSTLERMPEETEFTTEIMGISVARQPLAAARRAPLDLIFNALGEIDSDG